MRSVFHLYDSTPSCWDVDFDNRDYSLDELFPDELADEEDDLSLFDASAQQAEAALLDELFEEWLAMSGLDPENLDRTTVREYFEQIVLRGENPSDPMSAIELFHGVELHKLAEDVEAFANGTEGVEKHEEVRDFGGTAWGQAILEALQDVDADPNLEAPVDPVLMSSTGDWNSTATTFWGGIPYATPPRLAPPFLSTYPHGYLLAADLLEEGFDLLGDLDGNDADLRPALAKLEGSLALIERMQRPEDAPAPPWAMMGCLRGSIYRLRQGEASKARDYLASFVALQKSTRNTACVHPSERNATGASVSSTSRHNAV